MPSYWNVARLLSWYCRWKNTLELTGLKPDNKLMDAERGSRADGSCKASDNYLWVQHDERSLSHYTVICSIVKLKVSISAALMAFFLRKSVKMY